MTTLYWTGAAPAVQGVKIWTFATAGTIGDIITVTVGNKSFQYTTTSATIATFLPLLEAALSALDEASYQEFSEITWDSTSTTLTATDNTAGKPSTVTVSTNSGTTTINTGAITDATNASPIVVTSASHGLSTGTKVTISGVVTNTAANGTFIIVRLSANTFSLYSGGLPVAGNGAYGGGGTWTAPTGNTTTLSSGPYDISTAANYSTGSRPTTSDTLYVDLEGARLLYNLDYMTAVVLAVRRITAKDVLVGLPETNTDGTAYTEYRPKYWQQTATSDYVNTTSDRIKLNHLTGQTTFEQDASGSGEQSGDDTVPAVLLCGTHASNVFSIFGGRAGLAYFANDSLVAATLRLDSGTTVYANIGASLGTVNNYGGTLVANCAITTALNHPGSAGKSTIEGTGAVASINLQGGTCYYNTTGTLGGNTVLANSALLTLDFDNRAKTITNPISIYSPAARFIDSFNRTTGGYTLKYVNCIGVPKLASNSQVVVTAL